jgi:ankyrin repeat protein
MAASYARWELVVAFVDAGVTAPNDGKTPLHIAAGAGELDVVRHLVQRGADTRARDPEFNALPVEWARFLRHADVAEWLENDAKD